MHFPNKQTKKQNLGRLTLLLQVDIVWEYQNPGEAAWSSTARANVTAVKPAQSSPCPEQRVVDSLTVHLGGPEDSGRTYRCYPLINGQSFRNKAGTHTLGTVIPLGGILLTTRNLSKHVHRQRCSSPPCS